MTDQTNIIIPYKHPRTGSYLAADVDGHGVRELEGVEEGVRDDGGPGVRARDLHELGDHLGPQHAPVLVAQVDGPRVLGEGGAGLDTHVELSCGQTQHGRWILIDSIIYIIY